MRSGWARPAVRLSCSRLCLPKSAREPARPCPVWGHAKPDRSPLFCRYLTVCPAGGAGANIAGNQCGDGGGGPVRISGPAIGRAPAGPAGPVLSQCPECENGLEVGVGGGEGDGEQSLRVVDRFRFCSISKLDCGRLMLGLRLTGLAWGCSTRTLRHLSLVKRQVWVGERQLMSSTQPPSPPSAATSFSSVVAWAPDGTICHGHTETCCTITQCLRCHSYPMSYKAFTLFTIKRKNSQFISWSR